MGLNPGDQVRIAGRRGTFTLEKPLDGGWRVRCQRTLMLHAYRTDRITKKGSR